MAQAAIIWLTSILVCIIEIFMLCIYFNAFYCIKHKQIIVGLGYAVYGISLLAFGEIGNMYLSLFGTLVTASLILFVLYDGTIINKIISIASYFAVMISGEAIIFFIFNAFTDKSAEDVSLMTIENISTIIMIKIVQFCLLNVLLRFHKVRTKLLTKDFVVLLLLDAVSLFMTIILIMSDQMGKKTRVIICLGMGCLMIILNILLFYFFQRSKMAAEVAKENEILESRFELQSESIEDIKKIKSNLQFLCHDINQHLECMQALSVVDSNKANEYMNDLRYALEKYSCAYLFGNDVVDTVLYSKFVKAQSEGIKLEISLDVDRDFKIDRMDICCIFSNILDNAIEATKQLDEGKVIKFKGVQRNGLIVFSVVNPVKNEPIKDKNGNYITSKKGKTGHGLGLKSVEAVADKYGGSLDLRYKNGLFYVDVLVSQQGMTYE